jgi:protein-disulfide isomerase
MNYKTTIKQIIGIITISIFIVGCSSDQYLKGQIGKILDENPDLVFKVIEKNPTQFMRTIESAAQNARQDIAKQRERNAQEEFEKAFKKPLNPMLDDKTLFRGPKDAPITIVEYSDFECPFCKRGFNTIEKVMKKYPGKVKLIYKHLPLSMHEHAMISAKYFEAIGLQSKDLAFKFHDEVFEKQAKLKSGEIFLKSVAKKLKVDMNKLKKDLKSRTIIDKIEAHISEAKRFGMSGTPGFIVNGIPVRGAYPAEHFDLIISKLKDQGKIKL